MRNSYSNLYIKDVLIAAGVFIGICMTIDFSIMAFFGVKIAHSLLVSLPTVMGASVILGIMLCKIMIKDGIIYSATFLIDNLESVYASRLIQSAGFSEQQTKKMLKKGGYNTKRCCTI